MRWPISVFEQEILKTLSYFEPMTLEKLFLDFDDRFLINHPEFTVEELAAGLQKLQKNKLVKTVKIENQKAWLRIFQRKKSWWRRFIARFKA